jgi:hypothetical protein
VVTSLGRPDHHALEPLLLSLVLLAAAWIAADRPGRAPEVLLAAGSVLSFWNWNGSALYLALVAGFAGLWHVAAPAAEDRPGRAAARLATGFAAGAAALALTVALLGPEGAIRSGGLSGLSALQPALLGGTALACALLALARRLRPAAGPAERLLTGGGALLLPPALLALLPWSGQGIGHGLAMLQASGWYRTIAEFRPLIPSGLLPLERDLRDVLSGHGLTLLAVPAALPLLWRRWRTASPGARGPLLLAAVTAAGTLLLGWVRSRFSCYLSLAEAFSVALLAREAAAAALARWPGRAWTGPAAGATVLAFLLAPVLPGLPGATYANYHLVRYTDLQPLGRLADRVPLIPGREAVLCDWSDGHDFLFWSGRPVISSPFGIEGGAGALEVDAAFHFTPDQAEAEELLAARRVGLVAISRPIDEVLSLLELAPPGRPPVVATVVEGLGHQRLVLDPSLNELVAMRLWLWDGMRGGLDGRLTEGGLPTLDAFRLVGESSTPSIWQSVAVPLVKLFQPVPGLRLLVRSAPGGWIEASVRLRTGAGREETWRTRRQAGPDGRATLRLPYATGANGDVMASTWMVSGGRSAAELLVLEPDVLRGATVELRLGRAL